MLITLVDDNDIKIQLATLKQSMDYIARDVSEIKANAISSQDKNEKQYVTKEEFAPVKKIVFGIVTTILTAVVLSTLGLIFIK